MAQPYFIVQSTISLSGKARQIPPSPLEYDSGGDFLSCAADRRARRVLVFSKENAAFSGEKTAKNRVKWFFTEKRATWQNRWI